MRGLTPGAYQLIAFAFSLRTGDFSIARAVPVTIRASPWLVVDTPQDGAWYPHASPSPAGRSTPPQPQEPASTPFMSAVYPAAGGAAVFAGAGVLGDARPDVGAFFGAQFANAGYHLEVSTLAPGTYTLVVYGHSTVTGAFSVEQHVRVTIPARQPLMWIDTPAANGTVGSTFSVAGWAVEFNAPTGSGVDIIHIWATSASGAATFLGTATYGLSRPDVAAWVARTTVHRASRSTRRCHQAVTRCRSTLGGPETGTFRQWKTVQITVHDYAP